MEAQTFVIHSVKESAKCWVAKRAPASASARREGILRSKITTQRFNLETHRYSSTSLLLRSAKKTVLVVAVLQ
jgi:hypothetical protein